MKTVEIYVFLSLIFCLNRMKTLNATENEWNSFGSRFLNRNEKNLKKKTHTQLQITQLNERREKEKKTF